MSYDPLRDELIKITRALNPHGIKLIVGVGYGLLLRTEHVLETQPFTRFNELPKARSTEDLDFFLSVEIVTDAPKMSIIRDCISELGMSRRQNISNLRRRSRSSARREL